MSDIGSAIPAPVAPATGGAATTPDFGGVLSSQATSQSQFLEYQAASQAQQMAFQIQREAVQYIETVLEAALDESEKYRSNISQAQA